MTENILISGPITNEYILSVLEQFGLQTDSGGLSIFLGKVRADIVGGKRVRAIEYSAYKAMANREAAKIIDQIKSLFKEVRQIRICHSTGMIMAGENSMAVIILAVHRRQAIDACSMTVELIKERLPVWKREIFEDESTRWKQDLLA